MAQYGCDLHFGLEERDGAHYADHGGGAGHVVLHFLHAVGGLDGDAAGVEGNAFADQTQVNIFCRALGLIAQHDQSGRFLGSLGDSPECAHLELSDLVGAVDFALQADVRRHFLGAFGHYGWRHAIGRFVGQVAGEVLRLGDDASGLHGAFQCLGIAGHDDGDGVDLLVFVLVIAIALVVAGIEVAYESAFNDGAYGVRGGDSVLGQSEGKAADVFSFQGAHGGTG